MSRPARPSWHTRARVVLAGACLAASAAPALAQRASDLSGPPDVAITAAPAADGAELLPPPASNASLTPPPADPAPADPAPAEAPAEGAAPADGTAPAPGN